MSWSLENIYNSTVRRGSTYVAKAEALHTRCLFFAAALSQRHDMFSKAWRASGEGGNSTVIRTSSEHTRPRSTFQHQLALPHTAAQKYCSPFVVSSFCPPLFFSALSFGAWCRDSELHRRGIQRPAHRITAAGEAGMGDAPGRRGSALPVRTTRVRMGLFLPFGSSLRPDKVSHHSYKTGGRPCGRANARSCYTSLHLLLSNGP